MLERRGGNIMKWIDYAEVDGEGNVIEVYSLPIDEEAPEQYKRVWGQDTAFFEPKWDGGKWVEGATQDYIDSLQSAVAEPSLEERLATLEQTLLSLSTEED